MADSAFGRDLAVQFQALHDSHGALLYDWRDIAGSSGVVWKFTGSASGSIRRHFETLAIRGASERAKVGNPDLLIVWLEALRHEGYGLQSGETGSIYNVCEASANFCRILESRALQTEFEEKRCDNPKPAPASPPEETIAAQLQTLRDECRWTIEDLADATGISTRQVARHLSGEFNPLARK